MPTFRLTDADIDKLRCLEDDVALVDAYAKWAARHEELDLLIRDIETAFQGTTLGDGTGLFEANGLDNYASAAELARLRARDEHEDWTRIDAKTLNRYYWATTFMNARGFFFHLPAFLRADLQDKLQHPFIDRLIDLEQSPDDWMRLLNDAQRDAIVAVLLTVRSHPDYWDHEQEIVSAITRLNEGRG